MITDHSKRQNETIFSKDVLHVIEDLHSAELDRIDLAVEKLRAMDHGITIEQLKGFYTTPILITGAKRLNFYCSSMLQKRLNSFFPY